MTHRILVTCPPMLKQIDALSAELGAQGWDVTTPEVTQTLSVEELCELVPAHDGWIIGDDPANATVVSAGTAGRLRAAVKWGVGTDNVDFAAFQQASIPVENTPGMFGNEVADVALGYVIGLARHTFEIHQQVRDQGWPKPSGISLAGKTCGVVGLGDIGRQLCRRLLACDMEVVAFDPFVDASSIDSSIQLAQWPARLPECDFLCFTCALTDSNRHMFSEAILDSIKPGLRVVNVARGPLIQESALVQGLASGKVRSAALDVFEEEPLTRDNPLREFPQNVFGSHNGSNTVDAVIRTSRLAISLLAKQLG